MKEKEIKQRKYSVWVWVLALFLLSIIPLTDLLVPGLPITHDGQDHVARIANFYTNLQEGNVLPRWAGNLNWGYGHPILMFLYPLPSYFASLFHFLGFSLVDSVKLVFGVSFVLSGLAMYLWLQAFLPRSAALVGGLMYIYAPYRFIDLYVRGAIGEHVAFIFPPLVLYFLFKLSTVRPTNFTTNFFNVIPDLIRDPRSLDSRLRGNDKKESGNDKLGSGNDGGGGLWYFFGGAFSLAGLILAHNAISLMFLPIIFFYAVFLAWQSKYKKSLLLYTLSFILVGFALSAFFWLPAFAEGKYTLRDIVTKGSVNDRFVPFHMLLYSPWSYGITGQFSPQVGILHWLSIILSFPFILWLRKKKKQEWVLLAGFLVLFVATAFLMTESSRWIWQQITLLQKFQFPWRLLSLSVFLSAVLGAYLVAGVISLPHFAKASRGKQVFAVWIVIVLVGVLLFLNKEYWHAKAYLHKPVEFYTGIYNSTTDTGESAPIWSVRFMEKRPKARIEVIAGKVNEITELERTSTRHVYQIDAAERVRLRENTLYFPGWKIFVDGAPVVIEFQDRKLHGIQTFYLEKGTHEVIIQFEETKLRMLANGISIAAFSGLIILGILRKIVKS